MVEVITRRGLEKEEVSSDDIIDTILQKVDM
jgi:hypothetical protein